MKTAFSITVSADPWYTVFPYEYDSAAALDDKSETVPRE